MYLIGLTGGIATGKSTVSKIFSENHIPIIDADQIAREVVQPGKRAYKKLREYLGDAYFDDQTCELIRKKLGDLIFSDSNARHVVNSITHPEIRKTIAVRILHCFFRGKKYVVIDLPLLFESGYERILQKIILVDCPEHIQLERLQRRDGIDERAALQRIQAQYPMSAKRKRVTHIVDNSGSEEETREQVLELIREFDSLKMPLLMKFVIMLIFVLLGIPYYLYISIMGKEKDF